MFKIPIITRKKKKIIQKGKKKKLVSASHAWSKLFHTDFSH